MFKQTGLLSYFQWQQKPPSHGSPSDSEDSMSEQPREKQEWTRVKAVHSMKTVNIQLFDLHADASADVVKNQARQHLDPQPEQCIFDPEKYNRQQYDYSLQRHRLSSEELITYAEMATEIRARFALDASMLEQDPHVGPSAQLEQELKRSLNLQRQQTRFQRQFDPLPEIAGFEGPTKKYKTSRATRRDMSTR